MPVEYVVGRAGAMLPALARCAREAILLDRELIILVPRQLTLETEIALFDALGIEGSFRLQICSTARFLARVFEETGAPEGERIDEQGRAGKAFLLPQRDPATFYHRLMKSFNVPELTKGPVPNMMRQPVSPGPLLSWRSSAPMWGGS